MVKDIESIELFPFFNLFFNSTNTEWDRLTDGAKTKHFFMLRRFLCKKYPQFIQYFNRINDSATTIDGLRMMYGKPNSKPPSFMYIKANKKVNDFRETLQKFSDFTVSAFKKKYNIHGSDFEYCIDVFHDEVVAELTEIEKVYKQDIKKKTK